MKKCRRYTFAIVLFYTKFHCCWWPMLDSTLFQGTFLRSVLSQVSIGKRRPAHTSRQTIIIMELQHHKPDHESDWNPYFMLLIYTGIICAFHAVDLSLLPENLRQNPLYSTAFEWITGRPGDEPLDTPPLDSMKSCYFPLQRRTRQLTECY